MAERSRKALEREPDYGLYFSKMNEERKSSEWTKDLKKHVSTGRLIFN